ncbi:hemagglutinin [Herbaspirillum rubrisubalbicans Os34]|uniref:Hemagglutinin n=1 Tax=Herbaspirillum rubrisubalbicans Os34 TaxID=1235827 RepID=A0A6M3ZNJ4_9BURK|nr:hemagglutinin [Herbaspirillum rubrisubalbicans Os34]
MGGCLNWYRWLTLQCRGVGYAQQLAGKSPLEQKTPSVWVADLGGGQTVTLRSVSSSQGVTGARWTIDLRGSPQLQNINSSIKQFELKFR